MRWLSPHRTRNSVASRYTLTVASCYTQDMTTIKQLEKVTKVIPKLLSERDALVIQAKQEGTPVTHIAAAANLSRSQVHRIINENEK